MAFTRIEDQPSDTQEESPMPQLPATLPALGDAPIAETSVPEATERGPEFAYLKFFSAKANNALDVKMALGKGTQDGHPYIQIGDDTFVDAINAKVLILENFDYWRTTGSDHSPNRAWLKNPGFGAKVGKDKVQEATVCMALVIVDDKAYGCLLETRSGTKSTFVKGLLGRVAATINPQNDKDQRLIRDLGPLMSSPPRMRLGAEFELLPCTGSDFPYTVVKAVVSPLTSGEIVAISEWANDEAAVGMFQHLKDKVYAPKVETLTKLAGETTETPTVPEKKGKKKGK